MASQFRDILMFPHKSFSSYTFVGGPDLVFVSIDLRVLFLTAK